jgi:hypothetical protein
MDEIINKLSLVWVRAQCREENDQSNFQSLIKLPDFKQFATKVVETKDKVRAAVQRAQAIKNVMARRGPVTKVWEYFFGWKKSKYRDEIEQEIDDLQQGEPPLQIIVIPPTNEQLAEGLALFYVTMVEILIMIEDLPETMMNDVEPVLKGAKGLDGSRSIDAVILDLLKLSGLKTAEGIRKELSQISQKIAEIIQSKVAK